MIRINLLKPETKDIKEAAAAPGVLEAPVKKPRNLGSLVFLLLIVALGAYLYVQRRSFDRENELLATARLEKQKLQYVTAKLEEQRKLKASLERKINLINGLRAQQDLAARMMDQLSRSLPDWVWLSEVSYDAKGLVIKGKALSNNLIADYMTSLENSPVFANVSLSSSTQRKSQRNEYLEFTLTASLEKKPEAVPAAAKPEPQEKPAAKKGGTT
ncbi:MAG TPA: PilN domain-containing protein [Burkholderiales bacterium]|nr:PilN domain-containing protein [Burkholderiales bacterium]